MTSDNLRIDYSDIGPFGADRPPNSEEGGRSGRKGSRLPARFSRWLALLLLLAVLPFFTLVRVSVFLWQGKGFGVWPALASGALATVLLLILYLVAVSLRVGGKGRVSGRVMKGVAILVGAYCMFALLYLSAGNAKTPEIRATYTSLHPMLRVGVSTLLLADRQGVLTDTRRDLEDYSAWGISPNEASLHFPQGDGYVYAVDVRTLGRPEWRNRLVELYFRIMGFSTRRHMGTADHLHVSLPSRGGT